MDIQFHCQGISGSPWMNEFFEHKLESLERYLPSHYQIDINLRNDHARFDITTHRHEYIFEDDGSDLFDAFTKVLQEALKTLRLEHRKFVDRIHRKFIEDGLYLER